ncbi:hypothetical protein SAY86_009608 [Trapa natans]|uniref:Uncharacterized protein n=1 Tax=Trapa natans TaxID=22666 RepID=A0AAN7KR71_TRANT|nr:hypothetical protein SAY86_009608 [Trapa natans]
MEQVHGVENLTRDYTVGITEQCKIEEQDVLEEDSPDKNIQMDESGCKKDIDEAFNDAESFQSGSETEKIIWEETTASKSPENKLEEDNMPENVHDVSKQSSYTIQEVADSAHREISSISEPAPEVQNCEVSGTKQETLHTPNSSPVSGVDIHSQETINSEVQERDGKTTQEITSQTEVHELSTELNGIHTQTTSNETTASTGSEKLCKETTIMSNSVEEKVSCEEVDEGEGKTYESSLEEVTILKEIHMPSPVECTTIEDTDTGPGLDCIQVEVETLHAEEIETESGKYETMEEVSEKDRLQEEVTVSIPQTEDTREESSSNLIRQQNTIGQHNEEKAEETASQLLENQHEESKGDHEESKGDHEEAFHSISPEIGEVDAVEATFEVEKSEATTNTGGIEVVPMEVDVSDSQFTESVTVEETKSDESRDMEEQVLTLAPTAIAEKSRNETVVEAEKISEQNKTGTYMTLQNEALELSSAAELTTERLHGETIDSIPQTENAREESPSDLTSHQCIPMLHGAEDDEPSLVQGRHDGHEQTNEASEEASHSIRPETELAEVVEITLEEEKYEVIGNTRENEVVPREADVSDSQLTESVAEEEIKFSRSRELAVQVLSSIPTAIPESCEKEIADMVEKTDAATTQQNETLELSYAEEATIRIPQSEDAREESSSDLTNQQCIPTQLDAGEEEPTKIQVWHDEHEQIKGAPEGVGHSIRLETEVTDALEATFEEEKFEVTGNSRKLGVSRKVYISDSRLTNPVAEEEISIDQSRELLTQFLSPVTLGVTESVEDETVEMVEENKADAEMIQQNEISELSSIAVSTKVRDATSNGDPQANESMEDLPNEANKGSVNTGEDSKHEPMKEESGMTTGAYSSVGEACMLTSSLTDISPERTEVVQETSPGIQVEEKPSGLENLESLNLIVNEVTAGAEKLWENIIDTKDTNQYESPNDEEHPGEKGVNASERTKEAPKNNVSPEGGDCAVVSGVVEDEETKENNEEVSGSSNELSIKEEAQEEHGFDSIEQIRASVVVIKNESIKEAGVQEIEDPGYNDADAGGGREIIQDDISNKKDEDEYGKAHEGERNELVSVSCESSTAKFETSEEDGFKIVLVECSLEKEPNPNKGEPSSIAADRNIDGDQKLVSDAPANNVEEHLQEKIFEKAETPCEESSVVSLPMEEDETVEDLVREIPTGSLDVESRSIVLDAIASDADSKCHSDNALELNDIKGGGILVEEKHDAIGKANDPWRDIKEELDAEGGNTEEIQAEYQEKDPTQVEDIIAKILYEQIQGEIFEPEARITSKSETPVLDILESDQTKGEQVIASTEEMKEVENIEKEISEEADARCENIDPAAPLITETCVLTNELEKTSKEEKLQYNEVLLSTAAGASEATCMEMTEDISTKEVESVSDDIIHEVTHQLEDIEIKETHFNLTPMDSAAGEQNEKIIEADEILPDIAPREEKEEAIHDDNHKLKGEEVMKEKRETLKSTIGELQFQEVTKEHAINEVTAQNESDKKFFGRQETSEISLPEGEPTTEEWMHEKKLQEVKSPPVHNAFLEISEEIKQQESISAATCNEYFSLKMEKIADSTSEKPQESVLEHENPLPGYGEEKVEYRMGENESKEHEFMNETPFSPSNLLKLSVTEKLQMLTYTTGTKAEEAEMAKADETKTDEEYGENEADEHQHTELISERDTPLMVEPSKDSDVKAHHKKSHNILSGVGSRVKHSISKVKKAITGKSSCSKTPPL